MSKDLVPLSTKAVRRLGETKSAATTSGMIGSASQYQFTLPKSETLKMVDQTQTVSVDQHRSWVGGNQVGIHNEVHNHYSQNSSSISISTLLETLQSEIDNNILSAETIAKLQRYQRTKAYKGIAGLEAKLSASGREDELDDAMEMKELFVKLLEDFAYYASAQEIIAYLLGRAEHHFRSFIHPQAAALTIIQANEIVTTSIIQPTVNECSASVFRIDHSVAMGMVYWLAEQCHVRWHNDTAHISGRSRPISYRIPFFPSPRGLGRKIRCTIRQSKNFRFLSRFSI